MVLFKFQFVSPCTLLTIICLSFPLVVWGQTPEIPKDFLPSSFHKSRRDALRAKMPSNSVAVLFSNPVRNRANDVDFVYHQDPDFYYLTGYREPHSVLVLFKDQQPDGYNEVIFPQARNEFMEMWNGRRLGVEGVKDQLGFDHVFSHKEFEHFQIDFAKFDKVLFFNFYNDVRDSREEADLYDLREHFKTKASIPDDFSGVLSTVYGILADGSLSHEERKQKIYSWSRMSPSVLKNDLVSAYMETKDSELLMKLANQVPESNLDVSTLPKLMGQLREIKSPEEMRLLKKAIEISSVGQVEVMKAMKPNMSETEIQGIHEFVFKKYGAEYEGYPSIVGAGVNGCILHYIENNRPTVGNHLVLMDLGAEYHGYTADVTRTIPADGKFSKEEKAIYEVVLEAQEAAFNMCQVGNDFQEPHRAAKKIIDQRLVELGIVKEGESHFYFPHGTSHYLGLDVHDRGTYEPFKAGTVITVEPGIYIPENSKCDPKWWGIAVRIEDDILIDNDGWTNLSAGAPRTVEDIERTMAMPSALDDFILPDLDNGKR